jgi:hypothetical protein
MAWGTAPHLCCAIATADYRSSQISARSGVAVKAAACQVDVIVILDRKTPAAAFDRCMSLASRGLSIACPGLQEQERFLRKVGFPSERIPYESDNRRKGYLMALHGSTDFLISIDDDNFFLRLTRRTHRTPALHRDVIPSYYFLRMGAPLSGMCGDRYDDIFSGYFSQACARKLGDSVRVGTSIATHARNSRNYWRDATQELACIGVLEDLPPWLQGVQLDGSDYLDAYVSLSHQLENPPNTSKASSGPQKPAPFCMNGKSLPRHRCVTCERVVGFCPGQSARKASTTSMRAARAAGHTDAITAAASSTTADTITGRTLGMRMSRK